jgi:hypothetical protein
MVKIVEIFRQTQKILKESPMIWVLFTYLAVCDLIALLVLYTAPFGPHSVIFAPIIRAIWADQYLHYPANFLLLPKLMQHAHTVILLVVGIIITGIVIKKVEASGKGGTLHSVQALKLVLPKYLPMAVCWLVSSYVFNLLIKKGLPILPPNFWVRLAGTVLLAVLSQALLSYLLPAILLSKTGVLRGIKDAFVVGVKYIVQTVALTGAPVLVLVGLAYVKSLAPFIAQAEPERVFWLLVIAIPITTLADLWITVSTTLLFLKVKGDPK